MTESTNFRLFNFINQGSLDTLRRLLKEQGFTTFEIPGEKIEDDQTFFTEGARVLPQDPPLYGSVNWDAFKDSIWGGLAELGEARVAFIWTDVQRMLEHGLEALLEANVCFADIAWEVATKKYGIPQPVNLLIFLVGEGDNFKVFEPAKPHLG
jgi:hypothetical protein